MRQLSSSRIARAALALAGIVALGIAAADARPGGGNTGSRGSKTHSATPPTNTAPNAAAPMQRSQQATAPKAAAAAPAQSRFGSGFGGMLMGGLLGAGLFGLLSGAGLFSGLNGLAGMLGLLLQVALIGGLIYLAFAFFRSRQQPAMANAGIGAAAVNRQTMAPAAQPQPAPASMAAPETAPVVLATADYEAFEGLLGRIQDAYGREDLRALQSITTPEMANHFSDEFEANRRRNVHNLTSDAKLLQGDLAEAWSEEGYDYATVAMRYSLLETTVERGTGRVLSGDATRPIEVTELWTYVRRSGSGERGWKLSAIQQAT